MIPPLTQPPPTPDKVLRQKAQELESRFLSEMLRHTGAARPSEEFGGGIGEEQFSSFLRDEHARAISQKGGIGLAEHIYNALKVIEK